MIDGAESGMNSIHDRHKRHRYTCLYGHGPSSGFRYKHLLSRGHVGLKRRRPGLVEVKPPRLMSQLYISHFSEV